MKSQTRAILLLQYFENKESFSFASPVLTFLEQEKGQNDVIFSLDNFSDNLTSHYAKKLIEEAQETFLICDLNGADQLGPLQAILNYCVKKKNVKLLSIGENRLLKPFMNFLEGEVIADVEGLREIL